MEVIHLYEDDKLYRRSMMIGPVTIAMGTNWAKCSTSSFYTGMNAP